MQWPPSPQRQANQRSRLDVPVQRLEEPLHAFVEQFARAEIQADFLREHPIEGQVDLILQAQIHERGHADGAAFPFAIDAQHAGEFIHIKHGHPTAEELAQFRRRKAIGEVLRRPLAIGEQLGNLFEVRLGVLLPASEDVPSLRPGPSSLTPRMTMPPRVLRNAFTPL